MKKHPYRILVIGAGIIGASIAYHLAGDGARVTIVEGREPGGVVTPASFAWINASSGNPLYVAVLPSGITLAPAIGKFAKGRRDPLLAPYGPTRFIT